jgi:hypothetical protein
MEMKETEENQMDTTKPLISTGNQLWRMIKQARST